MNSAQDTAAQKRLMRSFISLIKEEHDPPASIVVASCIADGFVAAWPSDAVPAAGSPVASPGDQISQAIAELQRVIRGVEGDGGRMSLLSAITTCPVLLPLPLDGLSHLVRQCSVASFAAHATIMKQGDAAKCMMIVIGGSVMESCDVTFAVVPSVSLKPENRR